MAASEKPFLRGHFHQAAFFLALGACSVLVAIADGGRERASTVIYGLTLLTLFGVSSLYHRGLWGARAYAFWKRLDHAAIYIFMAGTATPICLLGIGGELGTRLLWFLWAGAALGAVKEAFWPHSPRMLSAFLYLALGWATVPYLPEFAAALGGVRVTLVVAGGLIYTAGALVYALKRPNPFPKVFGYHEIFHVLVVIASFLHFIVIYQLVRTGSTF